MWGSLIGVLLQGPSYGVVSMWDGGSFGGIVEVVAFSGFMGVVS